MSAALAMAAMMLPGAVPAAFRRYDGQALAVLRFGAAYFAIWTALALLLRPVLTPAGTGVAAALTIAAGIYELTPFKRECRRLCREHVRSGAKFGLYCVGSSIGLMAMLVAIGAMSLAWMSTIGAIVLAQKLVAPKPALDIPLALAIVALGVVIAVSPESVPGVMPAGM